MILSLHSCVNTIFNTRGMWRTLNDIRPCYDNNHRPLYWAGSSAVVCKVLYDGRLCKLRCMRRRKRNSRAIYGDNYYPEELLVVGFTKERIFADIIIEPWIEGVSLQSEVECNLHNPDHLATLAYEFDRLAIDLLDKEWAHGDLKPDNIIVDEKGTMHLTDFDAMYLPQFEHADEEEVGSTSFQHPLRHKLFYKGIDDYPISLISTVLHALSFDVSLSERFPLCEEWLINPSNAIKGCDGALDAIEALFESRFELIRLRIAKELRNTSPSLNHLRDLLAEGLKLAADKHR